MPAATSAIAFAAAPRSSIGSAAVGARRRARRRARRGGRRGRGRRRREGSGPVLRGESGSVPPVPGGVRFDDEHVGGAVERGLGRRARHNDDAGERRRVRARGERVSAKPESDREQSRRARRRAPRQVRRRLRLARRRPHHEKERSVPHPPLRLRAVQDEDQVADAEADVERDVRDPGLGDAATFRARVVRMPRPRQDRQGRLLRHRDAENFRRPRGRRDARVRAVARGREPRDDSVRGAVRTDRAAARRGSAREG
mmetsp:Transcript_3521/g.11961  ORF Transcript_3521/g.11961 Transcript_3521/m.11961 type:complete len:256 (+) Transcript_3521:1664-2431(+)